MLTYEAFSNRVVRELRIDCDLPVNPYDSLYDQLGLDSLQAFELIVLIEGLAGRDIPPPELPNIFTMQDAYEYFTSMHAEP